MFVALFLAAHKGVDSLLAGTKHSPGPIHALGLAWGELVAAVAISA